MNIPWQFVSIFFGRYDGDLNGLEGSGTNMEWADVRCVGGSISRQILIRFPLHAFTHITVHHRYPVKSGNVPPLEHGKLYGNIASYEIISPWYCWDIPCCAASLAGCPWCQDLFKEMFGSEDPFADFNKFFQDAPWNQVRHFVRCGGFFLLSLGFGKKKGPFLYPILDSCWALQIAAIECFLLCRALVSTWWSSWIPKLSESHPLTACT